MKGSLSANGNAIDARFVLGLLVRTSSASLCSSRSAPHRLFGVFCNFNSCRTQDGSHGNGRANKENRSGGDDNKTIVCNSIPARCRNGFSNQKKGWWLLCFFDRPPTNLLFPLPSRAGVLFFVLSAPPISFCLMYLRHDPNVK